MPKLSEAVPRSRAFTGAWIETAIIAPNKKYPPSRAFTGAWIETSRPSCQALTVLVAPSRARGLKHRYKNLSMPSYRRAFTGAWIETIIAMFIKKGEDVAPSRARGLKPVPSVQQQLRGMSRLHGRVD